MDRLLERVEALEHHTTAQACHTRRVERQLRWWRGLAGGLIVLAGLTWALPVVTAEDSTKGLEARVAALEKLLKHFKRNGDEVTIKGANLRIINGLGTTATTNGLGNLIVGYNELRPEEDDVRTGSHNVVVGRQHNFSRFGGLVVGTFNEISGDFAVVSGGQRNTASGEFAAVSGGSVNTASGPGASVSGGSSNTASGVASVAVGGSLNTAFGVGAVVAGGEQNGVLGDNAVASGGLLNFIEGPFGTVYGGIENVAVGTAASIGGGRGNIALGNNSVVSGGLNRTAPGENDWVAGSLFEDE